MLCIVHLRLLLSGVGVRGVSGTTKALAADTSAQSATTATATAVATRLRVDRPAACRRIVACFLC